MMRWLSARSGSTAGVGPHGGAGAGSAGGGGRGPSWVLLGAGLHFGGASLLCALVLMVFGDVSVAICKVED